MKPTKLTLEEHREASKLLQEIGALESKLFHLIANRPGVTKPIVRRGSFRITSAVRQLRSDLEGVMFTQIGGAQGASTDVYYPRDGGRKPETQC